MIRGHGQGRKYGVCRDSVLELLDQFPSPISTPSPVTPGVCRVSPVPPSPSSPSDTAIVPGTRTSLNSDTSSKLNTNQRRSEMRLFSPLFQEWETLQEQGNVQFFVPDGLASGHGALARPRSNLSSSSQGGVSDIHPRSHWTAEEEALLDEYRCRSVQESNSDSSRVTRDSSVIFYNPFVADEGDDEEGEEDLPIEALRKRLKLTSTLLPQSLESISTVLSPTTALHAQAMSTEGPGLAGIGCGPKTPTIVSTTVLSGYCPSVAPRSLARANHAEPTLKRWTEVPFKEYLPVDFELALGGTSRYPAFPSSPPSESQFPISPQLVVTNQPLDRCPTQSSPSVPSSLADDLPSPKLDHPAGHAQKRFSEQTLISNSRCLWNNPNSQDVSGVNSARNDVQTTDSSYSGSKRARRVHGASNWRPPTCWEMAGWEPAVDLVGERDDEGHTVTISPSIHHFEASSGSVASDSRAIFTNTRRPSRSSPLLVLPKFWRSSRPVFTHSLASRSPHRSNL
jgi:hypothetical protein